MPKKNSPIGCRAKLRKVCHDFTTFRRHVGYKSSNNSPNMVWKAGWPASADKMLSIIEDRVCSAGVVHQMSCAMVVRVRVTHSLFVSSQLVMSVFVSRHRRRKAGTGGERMGM